MEKHISQNAFAQPCFSNNTQFTNAEKSYSIYKFIKN